MAQTQSNNSRENITNPDVRPSRGQESNENWDDKREQNSNTKVAHDGESARRIDEQSHRSGYGSSQKSEKPNVGPLDADFGKLPSEKRRETGAGIE